MSRFGLRTRPGLVTRTLLGNRGRWTPAQLPGLRLWLDASDASTITSSGGAVSQWTSKDANARAFAQATGSLQPTTAANTLNGLNVVDFAEDYLTSTDDESVWSFLHNGAAHAIFAVVKFGTNSDPNASLAFMGNSRASSANTGMSVFFADAAAQSRNEQIRHIVTRGSTGTFVISHDTADDFWQPNQYALLTILADPGNGTAANRSLVSRNAGTPSSGNSETGAAVAGAPLDKLQIGALGNALAPLTGGIAEIVVYEASLTAGEVGDVETHLAAKWGVTLS